MLQKRTIDPVSPIVCQIVRDNLILSKFPPPLVNLVLDLAADYFENRVLEWLARTSPDAPPCAHEAWQTWTRYIHSEETVSWTPQSNTDNAFEAILAVPFTDCAKWYEYLTLWVAAELSTCSWFRVNKPDSQLSPSSVWKRMDADVFTLDMVKGRFVSDCDDACSIYASQLDPNWLLVRRYSFNTVTAQQRILEFLESNLLGSSDPGPKLPIRTYTCGLWYIQCPHTKANVRV